MAAAHCCRLHRGRGGEGGREGGREREGEGEKG
jgi:hypothetical protein